MKAIIKTMYQGNTKMVSLTARLGTAAEMLDLSRKLEDQQETGGCFGDLRDNLSSYLEEKEMYFDMFTETFLGRNDVIFELLLAIQGNKDAELEPYSEEILGYILAKIKSHFEWERICSADYLDSDIEQLYIVENK